MRLLEKGAVSALCRQTRQGAFVGLSFVVFLAGCELTTPTADLPKTTVGERWLCGDRIHYEWPWLNPSVVLTRDTPHHVPYGYGKVLVGGVVYDAIFSIDGVDRRWDWANDDMIVIGPNGDALYYDFHYADEDGMAKPREFLKCVQG